MEYIYKYLDDCGDVVYVGITKDMQRRVQQHKSDKLKEISEPTIFYFPVMYRGDAEIIETYLINYYGTGNKYNVAKTKKGNMSFLDICDELPWIEYNGTIKRDLKPFKVSQVKKEVVIEKEKIVTKEVYLDDFKSDSSRLKYIDEQVFKMIRFYSDEIETENEIIKNLEKLRLLKLNNSEIIKGLELHRRRLSLLEEARGDPWNMDTSTPIHRSLRKVFLEIEEFEESLQERNAK